MKKNLEKSKLERLYREGYSLRELARLYDCTHQKLSELFKEWGIPLRSKSETLKLVHQQHPEYRNKKIESAKNYNYDKIWFYNYLLDKWNKFTLGDGSGEKERTNENTL